MTPVHLGCVDLTNQDIARAVKCLKSRLLSPGPMTRAFEDAVGTYHQIPYTTYCNSGQSALQLILEALELHGRVRRVVVPALTYISSLHAVWNAGLQVVLAEVDPKTYTLSWEQLHLRGDDVVMPVHLFGFPSIPPEDVSNWTVVEDACEALGAEGIGYGDGVAFSFYVAHTITTGVGGMAGTKHAWMDDAIKRLCNHGRARAADLYAGLRVDHVDADVRFRFTDVGFSYKLGDVNAALGIGQMQRLKEIIAKRRVVAGLLHERLRVYPFQLPHDDGRHTFMMYPLVCQDDGVRDRLMDHLATAGIETRHMMPVTNQPIVRRLMGNQEPAFPIARHINERGFYVGCHQQMTEDDCDRIAAACKAFFV